MIDRKIELWHEAEIRVRRNSQLKYERTRSIAIGASMIDVMDGRSVIPDGWKLDLCTQIYYPPND